MSTTYLVRNSSWLSIGNIIAYSIKTMKAQEKNGDCKSYAH